MRTLTLALLALGLASVAAADDDFSQKPMIPPTVERGADPSVVPVATAQTGWDAKFSAGPTPLLVWGADPDKKYFLKVSFDAPGITAAKVKFSADNHVKLSLNGKLVGQCDEWQDGAE